MCNRLRRITGILAICSSLLLCLILLITGMAKHRETEYRSRQGYSWVLDTIPAEKNGEIRINAANAEEIIQLPGVGEKIAEQIISEREINGPFFYAEDMESVKGIGPKALMRFREMINLTAEGSGE